MPLYPLKFKSRLATKMWGGRKLETVLGKPLPPGELIGESWEIYDFPPGVIDDSDGWISSEIANGPLAGRTLHWVLGEFGEELLGGVPAFGPHRQFPLLVKFLDAREDLSVQVHPDQAYARQNPSAHLKTEAWYVVQADPGSRILRGLAPRTSREDFRAAVVGGTVESQLRAVAAKEGQCVYLPSGTVHALGAGVLVAEVQTPSDTTFRVFDFNRIDPSTGRPRQLHVEQALACIDFSGASEPAQPRSHVGGLFTTVTSLVSSPFFKIEKVRMTEGIEEPVPYDQPVIWMMLAGTVELRAGGISEAVRVTRGETALLPAIMEKPTVKTIGDCVWLEVTMPTAGKE